MREGWDEVVGDSGLSGDGGSEFAEGWGGGTPARGPVSGG